MEMYVGKWAIPIHFASHSNSNSERIGVNEHYKRMRKMESYHHACILQTHIHTDAHMHINAYTNIGCSTDYVCMHNFIQVCMHTSKGWLAADSGLYSGLSIPA
jgi:hypothetical protein